MNDLIIRDTEDIMINKIKLVKKLIILIKKEKKLTKKPDKKQEPLEIIYI